MLVVGKIVKVRDLELDPKSNKSPEPLLDGPATLGTHVTIIAI